MVLLKTAEEWQQQTMLLLQARPTTTKITTKYNIPNAESAALKKKIAKRKRDGEKGDADADAAPPPPAEAQVATLTLKTYDPASGVVLKFQTDKAADVGRLIGSLGRAGRHMAALPEKQDADAVMEDVAASEQPIATSESAAPPASDAKPQPAASGGGKRKKGKNKK